MALWGGRFTQAADQRFKQFNDSLRFDYRLAEQDTTAIRLLMGESSVLVLGGQRALPKRLEEAGFAFRWYDLEEALADVVR